MGDRGAANVPRRRARRNLLLLVAGNGVSTFGNAVYLVAIVLFLKEEYGSALLLGAFQFLALIPGFLLAPVSGALIDRLSRRGVIIGTDLFRGAVMIIVGVLILRPEWRSPPIILGMALAAGAGHAFFVPAAQALIPEIVPVGELSRATAFRAGSSQLFNMVGNAVGGVLYVALGAPMVLLLNGVTFLVSAVQESWIDVPGASPVEAGRSLRGDVLEALVFLRRRGDLRRPILSQVGMFLLSPVFLLSLPFLLIDRLGAGESVLGYLFALGLAGGIIAFLVLGRVHPDRLITRRFGTVAYVAFGVILLGMSVHQSVIALAIAALIAGGAAGTVYLTATVTLQRRSPSRMHGRLFAVMEAGSAAAAPAAYLVTGYLLDLLGPTRGEVLYLVTGLAAIGWAGYLAFRAPGEGREEPKRSAR
ncbi:MAG: MFS transporter [Alkalispirochaeta sp.]